MDPIQENVILQARLDAAHAELIKAKDYQMNEGAKSAVLQSAIEAKDVELLDLKVKYHNLFEGKFGPQAYDVEIDPIKRRMYKEATRSKMNEDRVALLEARLAEMYPLEVQNEDLRVQVKKLTAELKKWQDYGRGNRGAPKTLDYEAYQSQIAALHADLAKAKAEPAQAVAIAQANERAKWKKTEKALRVELRNAAEFAKSQEARMNDILHENKFVEIYKQRIIQADEEIKRLRDQLASQDPQQQQPPRPLAFNMMSRGIRPELAAAMPPPVVVYSTPDVRHKANPVPRRKRKPGDPPPKRVGRPKKKDKEDAAFEKAINDALDDMHTDSRRLASNDNDNDDWEKDLFGATPRDED